MTKTPDKIKKGLEKCSNSGSVCDGCEFSNGNAGKWKELMADALALIQQLQAENAEQAERIQQLEAERDAALTFLRGSGCDTCRYREVESWEEPCLYCMNRERWEWRGVQKEE